ncbi:hypothetical protein [Ferrithrix thermotolerans]|uniref:hypothetical protein n=1 Tax=Ferrithrix thermotolerans TaxID=209649 RepID=UPI0011602A45|nr:hypothetical protein [Ferrithrix thermotolerans]
MVGVVGIGLCPCLGDLIGKRNRRKLSDELLDPLDLGHDLGHGVLYAMTASTNVVESGTHLVWV